MHRKSISYAKYGYIFSIPFVLTFLVFSLYPLLYTVVIGFTDLRGVGVKELHLLERPFDNFKAILNNPSFRKALFNTGFLWVSNFIPQLSLALLLTFWFTNRTYKVKGQGLFKVLLYMPNIITIATIAILFHTLFGYPKGPVNDLFMKLGFIDNPVNFHVHTGTARGVVAFVQFWIWYGNTMIVLIAGVLGINPTLFEAAEIDGATPRQIFFRVTLPRLKTIILYVLVTSMIGGMQVFDMPKLFLLGGPDNATLTTSVFIYNQAFAGSYLFSRAAAASLVVFAIIAILSVFLFQILRDKDAALQRKWEKAEQRRRRAEAKEAAV
jgi:multiple sugar transport system permease protein